LIPYENEVSAVNAGYYYTHALRLQRVGVGNTSRHPHGDLDSISYRYYHAVAHLHPQRDLYPITHTHADSDGHSHANTYRNAHAHRYAHPADADPPTDRHTPADRHPYSYAALRFCGSQSTADKQ
jgi:hypothetical protein